ncbi:MAG: NADH-quinone oxidoreductase subunit J [Candidatus Eisenbacteria bacterium]|nr:NADH-quinone oxidoreductase subunit J [Candidatus Eisenbacteria bacterium]
MSWAELFSAPLAFKLLGLAAVVFAIMAVTLKNIFHCALSLAVMFFALSGVFVLLEADFLAVVQILIYVGAIVILMIFAIVLTERITSDAIRQTNHLLIPGLILCAALLGAFVYIIGGAGWSVEVPPVQKGSVMIIGRQLLSTYLEAFEVASVLLLAALVGAVFLGKEITKK